MEQYADFIIIGAGAAGLAAAQYSARANLKTLVLEAGIAGGQALGILDIENYPGVYPRVSGAEIVRVMEAQAKVFGAEFVAGAQVSAVERAEDGFAVTASSGTYRAPAVLLATGASRKLGVPGEAELTGRGVSYCASCDAPFFRNKHVAVVGGGNSACDEAFYLSALASRVTVIHRKSAFRSQSAADKVLRNEKIAVRFNAVVKAIVGASRVEALTLADAETGAEERFPVDGVFVYIGMIPQTALALGAEKDEGGYLKTGEDMQTSVRGLFCAGDVRSKPLRQVVTAASDGAVAAFSAGKYIRSLR
jgi:thioredoxin reductase (NADPH)